MQRHTYNQEGTIMPPRREPPRKRVSATHTGSSPEEVQQALYSMLKEKEEDPPGWVLIDGTIDRKTPEQIAEDRYQATWTGQLVSRR
jgi:hypothetical protein